MPVPSTISWVVMYVGKKREDGFSKSILKGLGSMEMEWEEAEIDFPMRQIHWRVGERT